MSVKHRMTEDSFTVYRLAKVDETLSPSGTENPVGEAMRLIAAAIWRAQNGRTRRKEQTTMHPDPIKMAFADTLADAAIEWFHAMRQQPPNIGEFVRTTEALTSVVQRLDAALRERDYQKEGSDENAH